MVTEVEDDRVLRQLGLVQFAQQQPHSLIKALQAVVIVGDLLADTSRIHSNPRHGFHIACGERLLRTAVGLAQKRQMRVRVVHGKEERTVSGFPEEPSRGLRVVSNGVLAVEVRTRDGAKIEGEGALRIDVQLADQAGVVAGRFQQRHDIRRVFAVHREFVRRKSDLAVLSRVQAGEQSGP